jgi:ferritin-like metal-binding protein YciE
MKKMKTLQDLFVEQLRDVYYSEKQLLKAIPKMSKKASSDQLKKVLDNHLQETENHVERLEEVFEKLEMTARGKTCPSIDGIIDEAKDIMNENAEPSVMDAGIIAVAQKAEHYEIATYGTLRTYANMLGYPQISNILQTTLNEEGNADKRLTEIAEIINEQALETAEKRKRLFQKYWRIISNEVGNRLLKQPLPLLQRGLLLKKKAVFLQITHKSLICLISIRFAIGRNASFNGTTRLVSIA